MTINVNILGVKFNESSELCFNEYLHRQCENCRSIDVQKCKTVL